MVSDSVQPRKQRKARADAPLHARKKLMHVHVSKALAQKAGVARRAVLVKKGDKVQIMRGKFRGKVGAVMEADYKKLVIFVEGVVRKNARGVEKMVAVKPSCAYLMEADFSSKDRQKLTAKKG